MVALRPEVESLCDVLARKDAELLQGEWTYLAGNRVAQVSFRGERFLVRFGNGEAYSGTFRLNPLHHPKAIDLLIEDGPERHQGKTALGIYVVDGPHLVLCPGVPGSDQRPKYFPPREDRQYLSIVFERGAKPARPEGRA
jgi:uncharacterized protein (TIGR03067 family)